MSEVTLPELPPLPYLPESQELRRAMIGWAQDYARRAIEEVLMQLHEQHKHQHNHFACAAAAIRGKA